MSGVDAAKWDLWARNLAIFKHEAETPMRGHDADGECCRAALAAAAPATPTPPTPPADTGGRS